MRMPVETDAHNLTVEIFKKVAFVPNAWCKAKVRKYDGQQHMTGDNLIVPIVLAGGKGTRLWPMSRSSRPKQFLPLTGDLSLFQQTLLRVGDKGIYSAPIVITNEDYRFLVAEQALESGVELAAILLEPCVRNTAPAIAAACVAVENEGKNQLVHILPSDHDIEVNEAYLCAIKSARITAKNSRLVIFGITPNEPATGFGYIEAADEEQNGASHVKRFVEKPDAKNAKRMLDSGNCYWNSGMFMFSTSIFLNECKLLAPDIYSTASASVKQAKRDLDFIRLDQDTFSQAPDISIDYAIFEKTSLASVVPSPIQWSDLGSWDAVWKSGVRDNDENLCRGSVSLSNTKNSLVITEKLHVAVDGLDDIAVVTSEDAIYVGNLSEAQNVGAIVKYLGANSKTRELTDVHQTTYRPWGGYTSVLNGERFQVKRLFVKPGKRLSLQKHHHRSEHWVVVRGTAEVHINDTSMTLSENKSVYIPQGAIHSLFNPGKILLELIEVQTGSYLGEDDIIRIEDEFG